MTNFLDKFRFRKQARLLRMLSEGQFDKFLSRGLLDQWYRYIYRQAAIPHTPNVVLRLTMNKGEGVWYIWAVYDIASTDIVNLKFDRLYIPDCEETRRVIPEALVDCAYFPA